MNIEQVREYTLSLPGVTEDQPFGDDNITFRLEGKIFLWWVLKISFELLLGYFRADLASRGCDRLDLKGSAPRFALKLSPDRNEELREKFSTVTPAWHWNKTHWSDVYYENMEESQVEGWIRESYKLVASKLPKTVRQKYISY